jgi:hypothetical protein
VRVRARARARARAGVGVILGFGITKVRLGVKTRVWVRFQGWVQGLGACCHSALPGIAPGHPIPCTLEPQPPDNCAGAEAPPSCIPCLPPNIAQCPHHSQRGAPRRRPFAPERAPRPLLLRPCSLPRAASLDPVHTSPEHPCRNPIAGPQCCVFDPLGIDPPRNSAQLIVGFVVRGGLPMAARGCGSSTGPDGGTRGTGEETAHPAPKGAGPHLDQGAAFVASTSHSIRYNPCSQRMPSWAAW